MTQENYPVHYTEKTLQGCLFFNFIIPGGGKYWGRGRKLGFLGYFRQEIDCLRPKYDPKWP